MAASLSSWLKRNPAAAALAEGSGWAGGLAKPLISSKGPSKDSRMRSKRMPIWKATVQPALSYGGRGGPPG